jgi:hypothetical protein
MSADALDLADRLDDLDERPVRVTSHARLAWLERVDPEEPYPAGALRDAWNRSEPARDHPAARVVDDLYLIHDVRHERVVILTVYPTGRAGA